MQNCLLLVLLWLQSGCSEFCILQNLMTYHDDFTLQMATQADQNKNCDIFIFENITGSLDESILSLMPDAVVEVLITRSNLSYVDICSPPNLRKISILNNIEFPTIDSYLLRDCQELSVLEISNVTLHHAAFRHMEGLQVLNLQHLNIYMLSNHFLDPLENLGFLRIENCEFQTITPETLCLPKVRRLNLISNKIFPKLSLDLFDTCFNLESLAIVGNSYQMADNAFNTMASLEKLYIVQTKIETITRNYFRPLVSLRLLHLSENDIKVVESDAFRYLHNIEMLSLRYSELEEIKPGTFENLSTLEVLDLTGNRLKTMNGIGKIPSLKKLDVSWNLIRKVEVEVLKKNFTSLNQFVVFGNSISCRDKNKLNVDIATEMEISVQGSESFDNCS